MIDINDKCIREFKNHYPQEGYDHVPGPPRVIMLHIQSDVHDSLRVAESTSKD